MSNPKEFSERLKYIRQEKGLSQKRLAELTGVSTITIQQYESGKLPKSIHLAALSKSLGCTTDWLLFGHDSNYEKVSSFNEEIFLSVIEKLEDFLSSANIKLTPSKKARVALLLYKSSIANGRVDTPMLEALAEVAS